MCVSAPKLPLNQCNTGTSRPDSKHFRLFPSVSWASWSVCAFSLAVGTDDKHGPKFLETLIPCLTWPCCSLPFSVLVLPQNMTMIGLCSHENFYWVYFLIPGQISTCVTLWLVKSCLVFIRFYPSVLSSAPYTAHDLRSWHGLRTAQEEEKCFLKDIFQ